MTAGQLAMLLGLLGVPAGLLWAGHRMRRRSPRWHAAFWGALVAHLLAALAAIVASMVPPEEWRPDDTWRGVFGFWTLLVAPAVGALVGIALGGMRAHAADRGDGDRHVPPATR
jgi:hypothetical protein